MPFLRNVLKDLVDKRLWPVALLLAAALVAAPVVLGRSGGDPVAPAPVVDPAAGSAAATAADGAATKAAVSLDAGASDRLHLRGKVRDPFSAPKSAAKKKATVTPPAISTAPATPPVSVPGVGSTGSTGSAPSGDSGSPAGSGSSGSSTPTEKPKTTTAPKADDASDTYHVSLRFGVDGAELTTIRDVARLSPLPSVADPFFVYLGVLQVKATSEKRAVFVVSSDATPNGEGACHPTKQDCETVELTVGQTAYFDYTAPDGKVTQYVLQLAGIHKTAVHAEAKAAAVFARHSVAGAELLRDAATRNVRAAAGVRAYRYLPGVGQLTRAKRKHVTARAASAVLVPGLALLDRKHQPGMPVWHSPKH
jgi:hypothetical protein